jgi:Spy/CpxP family protein refolding chaperone
MQPAIKEYMMKKVIKTTISILAVSSLLAAGSAFAQNPKGDRDGRRGPPSVEQQLARISRALELTDEQSTQMLVILQDAEKSRKALHEQSMAVVGDEVCAQKAATEEAILSILDVEQAESFIVMKAEREERKQGRSGSGKGRGGPDCSDYAETG